MGNSLDSLNNDYLVKTFSTLKIDISGINKEYFFILIEVFINKFDSTLRRVNNNFDINNPTPLLDENIIYELLINEYNIKISFSYSDKKSFIFFKGYSTVESLYMFKVFNILKDIDSEILKNIISKSIKFEMNKTYKIHNFKNTKHLFKPNVIKDISKIIKKDINCNRHIIHKEYIYDDYKTIIQYGFFNEYYPSKISVSEINFIILCYIDIDVNILEWWDIMRLLDIKCHIHLDELID